MLPAACLLRAAGRGLREPAGLVRWFLCALLRVGERCAANWGMGGAMGNLLQDAGGGGRLCVHEFGH